MIIVILIIFITLCVVSFWLIGVELSSDVMKHVGADKTKIIMADDDLSFQAIRILGKVPAKTCGVRFEGTEIYIKNTADSTRSFAFSLDRIYGVYTTVEENRVIVFPKSHRRLLKQLFKQLLVRIKNHERTTQQAFTTDLIKNRTADLELLCDLCDCDPKHKK